jgi:hypothetical protein
LGDIKTEKDNKTKINLNSNNQFDNSGEFYDRKIDLNRENEL